MFFDEEVDAPRAAEEDDPARPISPANCESRSSGKEDPELPPSLDKNWETFANNKSLSTFSFRSGSAAMVGSMSCWWSRRVVLRTTTLRGCTWGRRTARFRSTRTAARSSSSLIVQ